MTIALMVFVVLLAGHAVGCQVVLTRLRDVVERDQTHSIRAAHDRMRSLEGAIENTRQVERDHRTEVFKRVDDVCRDVKSRLDQLDREVNGRIDKIEREELQ